MSILSISSISLASTRAGRRTALLIGALLCAACASTDQRLVPTAENRAALGKITTTSDDNGNTELRVMVDHLAEPAMISPGLRTFVVWIRPDGSAEYLNVGQLTIDDEDRNGELETKTPHRDFEVLVTAEASSTPDHPSHHLVLTGHSNR